MPRIITTHGTFGDTISWTIPGLAVGLFSAVTYDMWPTGVIPLAITTAIFLIIGNVIARIPEKKMHMIADERRTGRAYGLYSGAIAAIAAWTIWGDYSHPFITTAAIVTVTLASALFGWLIGWHRGNKMYPAEARDIRQKAATRRTRLSKSIELAKKPPHQ